MARLNQRLGVANSASRMRSCKDGVSAPNLASRRQRSASALPLSSRYFTPDFILGDALGYGPFRPGLT